jgi:alpha-L-rhamnosidase
VENWPGQLSLDDMTGVVIYSDIRPTGTFECSNPMINQLQHNIQWGQKGNFLDVPTDCPQRDERLGWTGDAQVFARTACFNADVAGFFAKWLADVGADQQPSGAVPHVIPNVLSLGKEEGHSASAGWADAATDTRTAVLEHEGMGRLYRC